MCVADTSNTRMEVVVNLVMECIAVLGGGGTVVYVIVQRFKGQIGPP